MNTYHAEDILGSRARVAVLRVLTRVSVPLSIRQVARQAGLSHVAASETLGRLVGMGLVADSQAGRSRVHWLERRNILVREIVLPLFAAEMAIAESSVDAIRAELPFELFSAVLFGSRARGDNEPGSDFDVVVVERDRAGLDAVLRRLDLVATDLRAALGAPVSVLGYTLEETRDLIERQDNFMRGVLRDGITITGVPPVEWGELSEAQKDRTGESGGSSRLPDEGRGIPGRE